MVLAHVVYVLQSLKNERYYIGHSGNMERRLAEHNAGKVRATRYGLPWKLVHTEVCQDAREARRREYYLKSQKSRRYIDALIGKAM
ncbi:MAG: GIY-YIG nuclease family protein [Dehalococcoidia bacterium]